MIKPETLEFLNKLKKNNNRDWFEKNRDKFEVAKSDFSGFVQLLIEHLSKINPALKGQLAKDCIFRIYRDVRFSKNKDPYKLNLGAYICEGGKNQINLDIMYKFSQVMNRFQLEDAGCQTDQN